MKQQKSHLDLARSVWDKVSYLGPSLGSQQKIGPSWRS